MKHQMDWRRITTFQELRQACAVQAAEEAIDEDLCGGEYGDYRKAVGIRMWIGNFNK